MLKLYIIISLNNRILINLKLLKTSTKNFYYVTTFAKKFEKILKLSKVFTNIFHEIVIIINIFDIINLLFDVFEKLLIFVATTTIKNDDANIDYFTKLIFSMSKY